MARHGRGGGRPRPVRCDVPFVGRRSERTLLDAAVDVVRSGHSGVVSIVGEAGAGKTRLAEQIVDALENEAIVVRTACAPYGESNVWAPVTTAVYSTSASNLAATPTPSAAVEKQAWSCGVWSQGSQLDWYVDAIGYLWVIRPTSTGWTPRVPGTC